MTTAPIPPPPDEDRTKVLVGRILDACEGFTPVEAAAALATLAILCTKGDFGDDGAAAFAMMIACQAQAEQRAGMS